MIITSICMSIRYKFGSSSCLWSPMRIQKYDKITNYWKWILMLLDLLYWLNVYFTVLISNLSNVLTFTWFSILYQISFLFSLDFFYFLLYSFRFDKFLFFLLNFFSHFTGEAVTHVNVILNLCWHINGQFSFIMWPWMKSLV